MIDSSSSPPRAGLIAAALVLAAAVLVYLPALDDWPIADDWLVIEWALRHGFDIDFPVRHFRLWERLLDAFAFDRLGSTGAVVMAVSLGTLLTGALLLMRVAREWAPQLAWAPAMAGVLYALHPANASSIIQVDTFAQALTAVVSVVVVRATVFTALPLAGARALGAAAGIVALLFCKETALGIAAWLPVAAFVRHRWILGAPFPAALRTAAWTGAAALAALLAYLAIRAAIGVPLLSYSNERYSLHWQPWLWLSNGALMTGAGAYFGDVASIIVHGPGPRALAGAVLTAALAIAALAGLRTLPRTTVLNALLWASFAGAALVPAGMLGSVSELYVAGLTPFFALPAGLGVAAWLETRPRAVPAAALLALLSWGAAEIHGKIRMHRQVSLATWAAVRAVDQAETACVGASRWEIEANLADTTSGGRAYSAYSASYGQLIGWALRARREPFRSRFRTPLAASPAPADSPQAACTAAPLAEGGCRLQCRMGPQPGPISGSVIHAGVEGGSP